MSDQFPPTSIGRKALRQRYYIKAAAVLTGEVNESPFSMRYPKNYTEKQDWPRQKGKTYDERGGV
jgi:hypothetical protein